MTNDDYVTIKHIKERIDELEEEIYALFEAQGQEINPLKRVIKTISRTKMENYPHECKITLTLEDIRLLQDIRMRCVQELQKAFEKYQGGDKND